MPNNPDPIRCFQGNAQPHEPFWTVINAVDGQDPELQFNGVISEFSWMGNEVLPEKFKNDLYDLGKGGPITVRLNSPGGDVIAASRIRAIMTDYPGHITVRIDGVAASAAVEVAMAGKTIKIMDSAYMMIHDPSVVVMMANLDIQTLKRLADQLSSIKTGIVNIYSEKTGLSENRINKMMADTTWMSAQEAVTYGFANEVIQGGQKTTAQNMAFVNVLQSYENVPPGLLNLSSEESQPVVDVERERQLERLRDRVNLYKENNNG